MSIKLALSSAALVAVVVCAGCAGPSAATVGPTTPVATVAAPTTAVPVTFKSLLYGYTITAPAGLSTVTARLPWDGASAPGDDDGAVDRLVGPATTMAFIYVAAYPGDLAHFVQDNIAWNVRDHGDTCPGNGPESTESITIAGAPGNLLSWDCGILINIAVTVRKGAGFVLVLRDLGIHAATDPADRAILDQLLASVTFPR